MGKAVEKKKKGRPSLLDLQKRSLRLKKLQEQKKLKQNPNPKPNAIPNPYARFPIASAGRRSSRRNPNPDPKPASPAEDGDDAEGDASMGDDEDDDEPKGRRKEKKLKLVLHLPHPNTNSSDLASYASESNGAVLENRKIDAVGKTEGKNSAWKATEAPPGTSDLGPTTPLPDKKLLDFILDRLQKKDIYRVFSEPVDPEELPDYHDIIKHPMDFGTVRKKLSSGAYKELEQFEEDIYLISSNAMRYNATDTIYFRQARSIHELAKKSFENLRHGSDGSEREPKIVRRGRPPGTGKNSIKRPVGRPPAEHAATDFRSEASLANALNGNHSSGLRNDLLRKGSGLDQQRMADVAVSPTQFIQSSEAYISGSEHKSVRNEDYSGSTWKGFLDYGKTVSFMDESRRNTYKQYQFSSSMHDSPVLAALDGEKKILLQVGFHVEYAYARSLARFAAHLGPIGWKIAAKRIEKVLPSGMKFGPGWVGEIEAQQSCQPHCTNQSQHPSLTHSNISTTSRGDQHSKRQEEFSTNNSVGQDCNFGTSLPLSSTSISTVAHERFHDSSEAKGSSQFHHNTTIQHLANGLKVPSTPNIPVHPGMFSRPSGSRGNFGLEEVIAQAHTANTVASNSSSNSSHELPPSLPPYEERIVKPGVIPTKVTNHVISLPSSSKGPCPVVQGVAVDSQKPDLALQL
ncbi:hypothetical protein M5K25_009796 [Dendrobium thyrsiflorum]|uniref:Bromo domain-containing protein n=1 Tax=Dendrobium thyrsiflorum TaxID=117978 RepID=A0ABD0V7S0_DENTH